MALWFCLGTPMIGRTIIRWLAASGRPAEVAQRETTTKMNKAVVVSKGNWVTRTIQKNRVLTASGIAVVLFTYGGFAWSARPNTRLVRKTVDPIPDIDFGELLNPPAYTGQNQQLSDSQTITHQTPDESYHPVTPQAELQFDDTLQFDDSPQLDVPNGDHLQFSNTGVVADYEDAESLAIPTPQLDTPTATEASFPSLGLPEFPTPQLDETDDYAEPLRDSSNPFQSQ